MTAKYLRLSTRAFVTTGLVLLVAAPAAASDDLASLLRDVAAGSGAAQNHALERLKFLGPSRAGPPLRAMLVSSEVKARIGASAAFTVLRDPDARGLLEHALTDDDWEVRRNVAMALGLVRAKSSTTALGHALLTDVQPKVRTACARALAACGGGATALARAAAQDHDLEVRLVSLDALTHLMDPASATTLRRLLDDGSGMVRFGSARALAWQGDARGRAYLLKELQTGDEEEAMRAVTVLGDVPKSWALDALAKAAVPGPSDVAFAAASALVARDDRRGLRFYAKVAAVEGPARNRATTKLDALAVPVLERAKLAAEAP